MTFKVAPLLPLVRKAFLQFYSSIFYISCMQKKSLLFLLLFGLSIRLHALDYAMATDYLFLCEKSPLHFDAFYSQVAKADFKESRFDAIRYKEGGATIFINAFPKDKHALSFQLGYSLMDLNWNKNPDFNKKFFQDGIVSAAYVTTAIDQWRFVTAIGAHIDLDYFDLKNHSFYTGTFWGRFQAADNLGLHVGTTGQTGIDNTYVFPILGFDYFFAKCMVLSLIYPFEFSLHGYFSKEFSLGISYRCFGGWYRSYHRVGKNEPQPESIFTLHSSGVDIGAYYKTSKISIAAVVGGNIGGWILIKDKDNKNPHYFHYKHAPYAGIKLGYNY